MKITLDVHYAGERAVVAGVVFSAWGDSEPAELLRTTFSPVAAYYPGRFYERELPCLLALLRETDDEFETLLIDGYVSLRTEGGKGLGAHLIDALPYPAIVIGVAKSPLKIADRFVPVLRGRSRKPLYVSAGGCTLDRAAWAVRSMHGPYRIPTLLKLADEHARSPDPSAS